jgi:hypothetical protein
VRLAGYVLIELATGVTLVAGLSGGAYLAARAAQNLATSAYASEVPSTFAGQPQHVAPLPLERPLAQLASTTTATYFLGIKDEILLEPLLRAPIKRVKYNRGGSSISLRLDFEGGWRAAFKPDQTNEQTVPRKEIAAYRMSRLLGLESVSPAVGRAFPLKELVDKMDDASRDMVPRVLEQTIVDPAGMVSGELSWWIPVILDAKLEGQPIDSIDGMTAWHKYLTIGAAEPYSGRSLLPQVSSMVAFDYLINNSDRWSGSNAKSSTDGKTLFFMDNTLSFGPVPEGSPKVRALLEHVQKFSRGLLRRLRALEEADVQAAMAANRGPYLRLLSDTEIAAVMFRRERLIQYVDGLIADHGESEVLCYP